MSNAKQYEIRELKGVLNKIKRGLGNEWSNYLILYNSELWRLTKQGTSQLSLTSLYVKRTSGIRDYIGNYLDEFPPIQIAILDYNPRLKCFIQLFPIRMNLTSPIGCNWFPIQFPKNKPLYYEFLDQFQPCE